MTAPTLGGRGRSDSGGSIYDLGYRGYEGPRLGRRAAVGALLIHTLRTAYGLGRNARSKAMPVGLVLIAIVPSVVAIGALVLFAQFASGIEASEALEALQPFKYSTMFPFTAPLVFLFCAAQAPELFGRDQQSGVLPLYFSRAISRSDYALARLLGLFMALLVLALAPQIVLLVGRMLVAEDLGSGIAEELSAIPSILAVSLIISGVVGSLSAAIAALTPRRAYATVAIIAVFLIPNVFAALFVTLETGGISQLAGLFSPADVLDGVNAFIFGTLPENDTTRESGLDLWVYMVGAAAWIIGSLAVLLLRYRRLDT